ncbi:MFS transporter [Bacillus sp. BF2-3]|uniref:MFS transporter n=1 Tax=Bacillus sp. BF2-3 TaxID=2217827 RepID=UPI0011EC6640|nr:MFS transporter [Bacillus sp. BF2-3]KAA0745014.1 MFS transporter [Bacillus sp. BF2-3]
MNQIKTNLWTKEFIILSSINFFITLIYFLLNATITMYAMDEFSATTGQAGITAGIFIIGALIGRLFTGRLIQTKRILIFSLVLFVITTLLYYVEFGIFFLMLNRLINGITVGIATTVVGTVVAITLPTSRKAEGISYFAVSTALATGTGPFFGLFLSQNAGFKAIFTFSVLLGIISLVVAILMKFPKNTMEVKKVKGHGISNYIELKAVPIAIIIFIMSFCFSGIVSFINLYAIEIGLVETASFFFMVYTVFVLISRPFTGRLMDRKGANLIIYPAIILYGVGLLLLSSATNSVTLLLAGALIALGFGNVSSISQALAISLVEPHRVGLATSTFFIFMDLGNGLGPTILGLVIPATGYSGLYVILGFIVFISILLYYFLHGRKESRNRKQLSIPNK